MDGHDNSANWDERIGRLTWRLGQVCPDCGVGGYLGGRCSVCDAIAAAEDDPCDGCEAYVPGSTDCVGCEHGDGGGE